MATPSPVEDIKVQRTVTDLDTFEDVTLVNTGKFSPVSGNDFIKVALERLGNDHVKLAAVINDGLRAEEMRVLRSKTDGWMAEDEEGNLTAFSGTPADTMKVNALVLTLAKTVFGYEKSLSLEAKKAAKASAMGMIKSNDAIKNGLKQSAALGSK
jgi:hypothetical protein